MNRRTFMKRSAATLAGILAGAAAHPLMAKKPKMRPKIKRGVTRFKLDDGRNVECRWSFAEGCTDKKISELMPGDIKMLIYKV